MVIIQTLNEAVLMSIHPSPTLSGDDLTIAPRIALKRNFYESHNWINRLRDVNNIITSVVKWCKWRFCETEETHIFETICVTSSIVKRS